MLPMQCTMRNVHRNKPESAIKYLRPSDDLKRPTETVAIDF